MKKIFDKNKYTKWYITNQGEVFSSTRYHGDGRLHKVKTNKNKRGYLYSRTSNGNYQVHRLVASFFIRNNLNKPCVNHKDGDKYNNKVENLEWVTHKENMQHAIKNNLFFVLKKNEGNIKYTNEECKDVLERIKSGKTYKEAGKKYKMPYSTVAHLARGSRRKI